MTWLNTLRVRLGRHLGWRLLAVFIAAAMIPLAVSDWISMSVVTGMVQRLTRERSSMETRAASRQVFDRLMLSATLLRSIDEAPRGARHHLIGSAPGNDAPFSELACADDSETDYARLEGHWQASSSGVSNASGRRVALRVEAHGGDHGGLLMASVAPGERRCIALLNPTFVWEPVLDSSEDSTWLIRGDDGRLVHARRGPDAPAADADRSAPADSFTAHLFLTSEFGGANWTFEQSVPRGAVRWHGMPIGAWLLSVATATLLLIGLAVSRTIRKALRPLDTLAEGSRRLAAGISPARVDIRRHDELGRLADSFNHMAAQLEERMAALRALADLDAGILAGAAFPVLAERVLQRLAALRPTAPCFVAWREDDGRLLALRTAAPHDSQAFVIEETPGLADDVTHRFESIEDGLHAPASLPLRVPALAKDADATLSRCRVWAVRDGGKNRALLGLCDSDDAPDVQEARDLRDRLAVAIVARDREHQLQHRATHDLLTGLRNTWGLQIALAPWLAGDDAVAVLFIDLDHFKDVNDCYGHGVGDRFLQAAARRLERAAPAGALLSRNGGDEFVVVLPGCDADAARSVATQLLESLKQPFILSATEHRSSASIGISIYPDHGIDRDDLLRCADIALYQSKNAGRGRWTVFQPAFDSALRERNDLLAGLDRALTRSEFVLHYQPRLNATTGAIVGAEALVRWQHPARGLMLPGLFVDVAESAGLIEALGRLVMQAAIAQLGEWQRAGVSIGRLSVNVSQRQFEGGTLVDLVRDTLARHGVPGSHLEIEVTESLLGGDIASVRRQLHDLRALGITIAMDDFGTGYSSLSQLRTLPIDVMKIDRAFVKDLEIAPDAVAIARTIVTLARALGLKIVAEGIETPAQAALLNEMGCDEFQGFLFSKALPAAELTALDPALLRARLR